MYDVHPPLPEPSIAELVGAFAAATSLLRDASIRCARALAGLSGRSAWGELGCASVGEFGERYAVAAHEARTLLGLGLALDADPTIEGKIRAGNVPVASAALLGEVFGVHARANPAFLRADDTWVRWAETETTRGLRRRVRRRDEELRLGPLPDRPLTLYVPDSIRDAFARARAIASRKASRALSEGETLHVVVDHYLDDFDEDRVVPRDRRSPPTSLRRSRYVPLAVRREIFQRQGRTCAVPLCDHDIFLERAHLVPHAGGGDREADNLVLLCSRHHLLLDQGTIGLEGTAQEPRFLDPCGRDFANRYDARAYFAGGGGTSRQAPRPEAKEPGPRNPETRNPETRNPETRNPETRNPETRKPESRSTDPPPPDTG